MVSAPRERRTLATKELEQILATTPKLSAGSSKMFRKMKTNGKRNFRHTRKHNWHNVSILNFIIFADGILFSGIISYTEYLFLLSILTSQLHPLLLIFVELIVIYFTLIFSATYF